MSHGSVSGREAAVGAGIAACYLLAATGTGAWSVVSGFSLPVQAGSLGLVALGMGSSRRMRSRNDTQPSRTELAVEKVAGLLAMATGVGLLGPLVLVLREGEAGGVGAVVVGLLGVLSLLAGVALLIGYHPGTDED